MSLCFGMGGEQKKSYQRVGNLGSGWNFAVEKTSKTKKPSQNRITANCQTIPQLLNKNNLKPNSW